MATAQDESSSDDNIHANSSNGSDSDDDFQGFGVQNFIRNRGVLVELPMIDFEPENNDDLECDIASGWGKVDSDPIVAPFTGESRMNIQLDSYEPLDFFKIFINDDLMNVIVDQTNTYAEQRLENMGPNMKPFSRMRKWEPVTRSEMYLFFALVIDMGLVMKMDLDKYWSTESVICTPVFSKYMTKDRFMNILGNFHLADNRTANHNDPLYKIRPMIIHTMGLFSDVYSPGENLSFDEATCPWKGRLRFKVYNPQKNTKFGIKLYQVCEASGYCLGFDVYAGPNVENCRMYCETLDIEYEHLNSTTQLVLGLMARCGVLDKGHKVYMDNLYSSLELFTELEQMNTYACGTVRTNRLGTPRAIQLKRRMARRDIVFRRNNNMLFVKFHDKRDVHMLSSFHKATVSVVDNPRGGMQDPTIKPTCIVDYVHFMGGVDLCDQLNTYNTVARKGKKWWRKLFFHLMNTCIVNSYHLYKKFSPATKKKDHHDFRVEIIKGILQEVTPDISTPARRGRPVLGEIPERLLGRHFPEYITSSKENPKRSRPLRDCVACNPKKDRQGTRRRQTSFCCSVCRVSLCVPDCFRVFHTSMNYLRDLQGPPAQ